MKVLRLVNLCFCEIYLPPFSSELKILTLHNVAGINDETLRLMIERSVFLAKLICNFTSFTKHTISDGYMQSLVSTRQKFKVIFNQVSINEENLDELKVTRWVTPPPPLLIFYFFDQFVFQSSSCETFSTNVSILNKPVKLFVLPICILFASGLVSICCWAGICKWFLRLIAKKQSVM